MFSGEDPDLRLSDWLHSLKCAAEWNALSSDELMLQMKLAEYLKGRS